MIFLHRMHGKYSFLCFTDKNIDDSDFNLKNHDYINIGPEIGSVFTVSSSWQMLLGLKQFLPIVHFEDEENHLNWEQYFFSAKSYDMRTQIQFNGTWINAFFLLVIAMI